jgi:hypothetical protein
MKSAKESEIHDSELKVREAIVYISALNDVLNALDIVDETEQADDAKSTAAA